MPERKRPGMEPVPHPHDRGYRQLLSNKRAFLDLIRTFVREKWADEIREDDLVLVNRSYVSQDFRNKEADIVYRLRTREKDVIFYVLLELQSTVDHLMPFRLLQYMVEIWREMYRNTPEHERTRKDFRLPAIIPAVLYNGPEQWTAGLTFRELLAEYREFGEYLLDFRYLLFDVNRYDEEALYQMASLMASVFVLDRKAQDSRELLSRLRKLAGTLERLTPDEFHQVAVWLRNVLGPQLPGEWREKVEVILKESQPWEVEKMITNLEISLEEWEKRAEQKGEHKGKLEGKLEVARAALAKGLDVDMVVEITGLSREEVARLKEDLN